MPFSIDGRPSIEAHVKAGKVKLLAISTAQRAAQTPEVPTVAEAGIAGYEFIAEIGFFGIDPMGSTPEAYNAANRASYEKYAQVVKAAGVKIE